MFRDVKGATGFISVERGLMLFLISVAVTFLMAEVVEWSAALFLGLIVFCAWSSVDAMNNLCDVDLDVLSDPFRAEFTRKLGKTGLLVICVFAALSLALSAATLMPFVFLYVALGLFFGVVYSVPPFRLRRTRFKPVVNFTVGAVPVMIVAAFFSIFSMDVVALVLLMGATTAINSLWEDLADYESDFANDARTLPVVLGFRNGLLFTILMGYALLPLMTIVGVLFELSPVYYVMLAVLACMISLRLVQKRKSLVNRIEPSSKGLFELGETLAKDFVVVAILFTAGLMISSLLRISPAVF